MPNNFENDKPSSRRTPACAADFPEHDHRSFLMPAAENPTVAMIEVYEHHHIDARYFNCDVAPDALGDGLGRF